MQLGPHNGWTLTMRFRQALAELANKEDLGCEVTHRADPQYPHLLFRNLHHLSVFSHAVCALKKLQLRARLHRAEEYASLDRSGLTVPVVWHQRGEEEPTGTLLAEDLFWLLGLAEQALAMEAVSEEET